MPRTRPSLLAALLVTLALPHAAVGQDGSSSQAQLELNRNGVEAMRDGDYDSAVKLFVAANKIAELNVTWLNLGRSYAKLGRCDEAIEAFARVEAAPAVPEPTPAQVSEALARYTAELPEMCPGKLLVSCDPEHALVHVADRPPERCLVGTILLPPGSYEVHARVDEHRSPTVPVTIEALGESRVELRVDLPEAVTIVAPPTEPPADLALGGWIGLGIGGTLLASALVIELAVLPDLVDEYETAHDAFDLDTFEARGEDLDVLQPLNLALYVAGGLAVATGATLLVIDALRGDADSAEQDAASTLAPWLAPTSAGATWSMRW